jgi:uncharacterized protein (TIRG00374 family)
MVRILAATVGLIALALLCWWFGLDELRVAFDRLDAGTVLIYLALLVVVLLGYCLRWKMVTRALGSDVPFRSLVSARLAGDAVGTLIPSAKLAGEPVRIALVHAAGVRGSEAAAGVALDRVMEVIGNILAALAYVTVFAVTRTLGTELGTPSALSAAMVLGLAALSWPLVQMYRGKRPLAFLYSERTRKALPRLSPWLDGLQHSEGRLVDLFHDHPRIVPRGILASLGIEGLIVIQYDFLLKAFGLDLDLPTLLMVLLGSGVARTAPTPAGLGALEAAQVAVLAVATGDASTGFVVGIVLRLHETLLIAAGLSALLLNGVSLSRLGSIRTDSGAAA